MKKKSILKVLLLTLLACCLAFALVACGGTTYTVTYDYNDGGATQSTTIEVDEGSLLEEPTAPTRDGYTFDGWFNGDAEWTFATDTVTGDITLTAHWTQNVTPPPAHTHTYGDYTLTTAPTESAAGVATATCSGCEEGTEGHTTTMALPALTEANISETAADGKYTVATTAATCTAAGSSVYTYHYGDKTLVAATVSIPMAAHTYGTEIAEVPATCETAGTAAHYECSVCHKLFTKAGDTYTEVTAEDLAIAALGHTYGDLIAEDPATCTEDGMEAHYFCDVCDTYFDSEKNPTTEADLVIESPGHTYGDLIAEDPATCTEDGMEAHYFCDVCDTYFDSEKNPTTEADLVIESPGHTYGELIAEDPATCTETGMKAHYFCEVCDSYFDSKKNPTTADALTIPMVAHSYTADVELEGGTYTITGSCSTCETINVTATLTLEKGEEGATGSAPETLDVTFDGASFTVTLPACPYVYDGYEFTGWLNGTETVGDGATLSLDANEEVTLTAQWALVTKVSNEAELRTALANADIGVITVAQSFEIDDPVTISRDVTIDLNDQGLTFTGDGTQLTIQGTESERIDVTLRSGSITFTTTASLTSTCIAVNLANATIDDVNITTGTTAIFPAVATLTVRNSTITASTYGIGTNASVKVEQDGTTKEVFGPVYLMIENSIVKTTNADSTAVLFNVEGTLTVTDSDLEGGRQGLILRKGEATITGGSITSRWEYTDVDQYIPAEGAQAAWRTGNEVPMAAIVIGDTDKNAYNGDAILTISGTEVKLGNADATRYIYLWADTTDRTAAQLIYACDDAYMPDLAAKGQIVCGNGAAEVTVTHAALTHYDAKEATCTEAGNVEYSYCETCDTYFDAEGDVITQEEIAIRATGHGLGDLYIATKGAHIGYLVADCSKCNEQQIAIGEPKSELEVSFIDGKTGYAIGDDISLEDFNVVMTFEILIDVADGLVAGGEQEVNLTDESVPENIKQYLESNLDALTAESWANDLKAAFTFAVGGTTVAEGAITFDVVPSSSQLGIGDAAVLYNKAGDATNHQVDSYENIQYLGNVDETGVSVSFWLSKVITSDWLAFINSCGVCIGLPNLDPWNALADIPEAAQFREMNKTPAPENLCGEAVYSMFLRNESFVTITITAEGSVQFYKNGVEVIVYNSTDEMSDDTTAVGDFATTLLSLMATYGFVFAGADGVAAENLFITEALSDSAVAALYNWYAPKYVPEEDAALRQTVATTLGEDVTIYTADAGAASATIYSAGTFTNLSETGLTIMFYIPEGGSMSGGSANDWQPVITSNGYIVGNGCLDAWSATGTLTGWSKTEMTAASGEGVVWDEFAHGGCTITVTITTTDGVLMYKDGNLVFDHDAGQNGTAGTGTVKDFVDCLFAALESSGGRIAGATAANTYIWAEDLVVTSALASNQVRDLYNAVHPAQS